MHTCTYTTLEAAAAESTNTAYTAELGKSCFVRHTAEAENLFNCPCALNGVCMLDLMLDFYYGLLIIQKVVIFMNEYSL